MDTGGNPLKRAPNSFIFVSATPAPAQPSYRMSAFPRFVLHNEILSKISTPSRNYAYFLSSNHRRRYCAVTLSLSTKPAEETLVVVGGGAAGMYGAIRAKTVAPDLNVFVIEKGKPLSKVRISGGGRCNVTNGHCVDNVTEVDGRVFPISNSSSTIIDCLMSEAKNRGVVLQTGKAVTSVSTTACGKFSVKIEKRTVNYVEYIEANYVMIASGSSEQGYKLAAQLGHSIVKPVPSLFTFKIDDFQLVELSGVGPMLVTHWGFSGPVILRLSAWGARELSDSDYKGSLVVDFVPDLHIEDVKAFLVQHKNKFAKQRVTNSFPSELGLVKRFWRYILEYEDLVGDLLWASISNNLLIAIASRLKNCCFRVKGKISLNTMQSRIKSHLFFAGEVLNVDGVTGGFNFQNAWSGGYIAGTSIGNLATAAYLKEEAA
ncbi:UNVERIFIED_CONTAM: 3-dehydro-bile acid delta(4,6)-reductase [Sesamum radiatum]|uniref:3-dehydro-bile acid delta(4,6)-reductase n=1 Tax=Sesamum radiatum TaxID=300843 RepID=A0AAW2VTM9_SESRA